MLQMPLRAEKVRGYVERGKHDRQDGHQQPYETIPVFYRGQQQGPDDWQQGQPLQQAKGPGERSALLVDLVNGDPEQALKFWGIGFYLVLKIIEDDIETV